MINVPLSTIKEKILENTDLTEEQLSDKIKEKLDQLSGLISEEGAAHIIANELGVKLLQTSGKLEIKNILAAQDLTCSASPAPACGLCLVKVDYPD